MVTNTDETIGQDTQQEAAADKVQEERAEISHKKRNYKKELEDLEKEHQALKDQLLRLAAEFDNYRKRVDRDMSNLIRSANADLVTSLLPILDDLDRSIAAANGVQETSPLLEGIKLIQKSFLKTLQDQGLKYIESIGQPFDPEKHDALLQMPVDGKESNVVIEEHVKGYEFKDRVIRHAKVIVSK